MPFKDKEKQREYNRLYKKQNRDELLEKRRIKYRDSHIKPDFWTAESTGKRICLNCGKVYCNKPAESCTEPRHLKQYLKRRERDYQYRNKRRLTDPYYACGYTKEEKTELHRLKYRELKNNIITKLGGKCRECGVTDNRVLQIDHIISGNGRKEVTQYGWGYRKMLNKLSENELREKYQVLCANCHSIKNYNERYKKITTAKIAKKED